MSAEILIVLLILTGSMVFLVTEWIPMEVTALLVLGAVAVSGLLEPVEALAGFSSPAVVTIWAVFIISGGLTHTGVATVIGHFVMKIAGPREITMTVVIMATAGGLSAIMNNVAVAALMLPVVMDIGRKTAIAPSRLLMPLAFGCLLGGMTTQIGTPPNIIATEALRESGLETFSFFDFTPVGLVITVAGIAFMAIAGRQLLPRHISGQPAGFRSGDDLQSQYGIGERLFQIRVPADSPLAGKALGSIRLGSILGWNVIAITRGGKPIIPPGPDETLQPDDLLTIEGRLENLEGLRHLMKMKIEKTGYGFKQGYPGDIHFCEVIISHDSALVGSTLKAARFAVFDPIRVIAISTKGGIVRAGLQGIRLSGGDRLLVAGKREHLETIFSDPRFEGFRFIDLTEIADRYQIQDELMIMAVPDLSEPTEKPLTAGLLSDILGNPVLCIIRDGDAIAMPEAYETLQPGDQVIIEMDPSVFKVLERTEALWVYEKQEPSDLKALLSGGDTGIVEAMLAPGAAIGGKTLRQLNFREKYGLNVLALWRRGRAYRTNLKDMELTFGDAMVLFGSVKNLQVLDQEPDFMVLTHIDREKHRTEKMKISLSIVAAILLVVIMGWIPIYIAAVIGAAVMVLTGCLTMNEAYRQIEWKAVFLIAGMIPLGTALDQTGAAMMAAQWVIAQVGPYGPDAILFGLVALTVLSTCILPIPAVVVLMVPIVLNTAAGMDISPQSLMMGVSMAASASFITPISHPAKLMVMGPGGYAFKDYLKTGIPLTLFVLIALMIAVPFFWPLVP